MAWLVGLMVNVFVVSLLTLLSVLCWLAIGVVVYETFGGAQDG